MKLTQSKNLHYAWVIVIICAAILASAGFAFYPFGILLKPITESFGWGRGSLSAALSLATVVGGVLGILSGRLSDRFGPRPIVIIGGLLSGIAFLLLPQISALWHVFLILGILMGIGGAFCIIPVMPLIPRWFTKRRGIAMGIAMSGFGIGGIIAPPLTQWLISTYDWQWSCRILGLITLVIIIPVAQFLKPSPQQVGLKPYGEDEITEDKQSQSSAMGGLSLTHAIRTRGFWLFGLIQTCALFCPATVMIHIVAHATDIGIPAVTAATILSFVAGFAIIGRLAIGFISDRIGGKLLLTVCLTLITLALIWLLFAKEIWMFYLFAAAFGLANGGFTTLFPVVSAELFGLVSLGVIIGGLAIFATLGEALGAPVSGAIFDITGSYRIAFLICIGACTVAVILSLVLLRHEGITGMVRE
jgi:MFS family permease